MVRALVLASVLVFAGLALHGTPAAVHAADGVMPSSASDQHRHPGHVPAQTPTASFCSVGSCASALGAAAAGSLPMPHNSGPIFTELGDERLLKPAPSKQDPPVPRLGA